MNNIRTACEEYVALLDSPPNGWGQHIHPIHGQSHNLLRKLYNDWSEEKVKDCLQTIFKRRKKHG